MSNKITRSFLFFSDFSCQMIKFFGGGVHCVVFH
jgi:hypothetical protein